MEKKFVTIKEAADILGVSPLTLRNWDKSGKFKAVRHPMNNYRVYKTDDLAKLTDSLESSALSYTPKKKSGPETVRLQIKHLDD